MAVDIARRDGRFENRGLARAKGRYPLLGARGARCGTRRCRPTCRFRQDHPRHYRALRGGAGTSSKASAASGCWCRRVATTPSSCSTPKAGSGSGIPALGGSRGTRLMRSSASAFPASTPAEDRAAGMPEVALERGQDDRPIRGRGLAAAQGRQPVLGQRGDRCRPRRGRRAHGLCQGDPRHPDDAAQRSIEEMREQMAQMQRLEAIGELVGGVAHNSATSSRSS